MRRIFCSEMLSGRLLITFILTGTVYIVSFAYISQQIEVVKDIKPNIYEHEYTRLNEARCVTGDFGGENILFLPSSMTLDNNGDIYVFDHYESKVFKFNKDFELLKTFCRQGQGPGEVIRQGPISSSSIHVGRNGKFYVNNRGGFKVIEFDLDGNFIRENKFKLAFRGVLVDSAGYLYVQAKDKGVIDIFNKDFSFIGTMLSTEENYTYLFRKPEDEQLRFLIATNFFGQSISALTLDSKLIIYLMNSSKAFIIQNQKIIDEIYLYPKAALDFTNELTKEMEINLSIFDNIFVDEDDAKYFYLTHTLQYRREGRVSIYKFNLRGELADVYYIDKRKSCPRFQCKKNGTFYAFEEGNITLFKEVGK